MVHTKRFDTLFLPKLVGQTHTCQVVCFKTSMTSRNSVACEEGAEQGIIVYLELEVLVAGGQLDLQTNRRFTSIM